MPVHPPSGSPGGEVVVVVSSGEYTYGVPDGWEMAELDGQFYYIDHKTKSTHWDLPGTALPQGWEQHECEGEIYYADHNAKATHWELPVGFVPYASRQDQHRHHQQHHSQDPYSTGAYNTTQLQQHADSMLSEMEMNKLSKMQEQFCSLMRLLITIWVTIP